MVHTITLREYEEYPCRVGEGALDPAELAGLEHFLNRKGLSKALTLTARGCIRARNYVGVIRYRKLQIQILPKLISEDDSEQANIIDNLIFMLSYTQKLDIRTSEANLYRKENGSVLNLVGLSPAAEAWFPARSIE